MKNYTPSQRWRSIAVIAASALSYGMIISFSVPLVTLILDQQGYPTWVSGANAAMPALGILLTGPFIPRLAHKLGALGAIALGILMMVICMCLFTVTDNLAIWFALRFFLGVGSGIQWMISEIWISTIASENTRGRAIALFTTLMSIGFALGPQLIIWTGTEGAFPFLVGAAVVATSSLVLPLARGVVPELSEDHNPSLLWSVLRFVPVALAAAMVSAIVETNAFNFFPLYMQRIGFSETAAVMALSAFTAGSVVSQIPLGWLSDRINKTLLMTLCCLLCVLGTALFPLSTYTPWLLWPLLFIWGGIVVGFYTVGLAACVQQVKPSQIAPANAAFVMAYTIGLLVGPPVGGLAMDIWNPYGLLLLLGGIFLIYGIVVAFSGMRKRQKTYGMG